MTLIILLVSFNIQENEIAVPANEYKPAGSYAVSFDGSKLASGVYFYQIKADNYFETKKIILIK